MASTREKTILDKIVDARRESVAHRKRVLPEVALKIAVQKADPPRDFAGALTRGSAFNIIAELKKASPSKGILREDYQPALLALSSKLPEPPRSPCSPKRNFFWGRSRI